jgi:glyoxylase-like metal-dependent hydrolase (beta-lactamase superfamily II)
MHQRREIADSVVARLFRHHLQLRERRRHHQERVSVGRGPRGGADSDEALRPCAILHHDILLEAFAQLLAGQPRQNVRQSARAEIADDRDRAGLIGLRVRRADSAENKRRRRSYASGAEGTTRDAPSTLSGSRNEMTATHSNSSCGRALHRGRFELRCVTNDGSWKMDKIWIGDVSLTRVPALRNVGGKALMAGLPPGSIERNLDWLAPTFYDVTTKLFYMSSHAWLIRTRHFNILVDPTAGNHKTVPNFLRCHQLEYPFLDTLRLAGCTPEEIDYVLCTHAHPDHVGWNTTLENGRWVPTFPNARYILARKEFDHANPATQTFPADYLNLNVFEESVQPVFDAGKLDLVDDRHEIEDGIVFELAAGHSPGHSWVKITRGDAGAIIAGDILHVVLEIPHPDVDGAGCVDRPLARKTRRHLLDTCAENNWLVMPAHFPAPYSAVRIQRRGDAFSFTGVDGAVPERMAA